MVQELFAAEEMLPAPLGRAAVSYACYPPPTTAHPHGVDARVSGPSARVHGGGGGGGGVSGPSARVHGGGGGGGGGVLGPSARVHGGGGGAVRQQPPRLS